MDGFNSSFKECKLITRGNNVAKRGRKRSSLSTKMYDSSNSKSQKNVAYKHNVVSDVQIDKDVQDVCNEDLSQRDESMQNDVSRHEESPAMRKLLSSSVSLSFQRAKGRGGVFRTFSSKIHQKPGRVQKAILRSNDIYNHNSSPTRLIPNFDVQMNRFLIESSKCADELPFDFDDDNVIPATPDTTTMKKKNSFAVAKFSRLNQSVKASRSSQREALHEPVINVEIPTKESKEIRTGRRFRKGLNLMTCGEDAKKTTNVENTEGNEKLQQEKDCATHNHKKAIPITEQKGSKEMQCKNPTNSNQFNVEEPDMVSNNESDLIKPKAKLTTKRASMYRKKNVKSNKKTVTIIESHDEAGNTKSPSPIQKGGVLRTSSLKNCQKSGRIHKAILRSKDIYNHNQSPPHAIPNFDIEMNRFLIESSKSADELPFDIDDDDNVIPATPDTTVMKKKNSFAVVRFSRLNQSVKTTNESSNIEMENNNSDKINKDTSKAVTSQSSQREALHEPVINVEIPTNQSEKIRTRRRVGNALNKLTCGVDVQITTNEENTEGNKKLQQKGSKETFCKETTKADQDISGAEKPDVLTNNKGDLINPKAKITKKLALKYRKLNEKSNKKVAAIIESHDEPAENNTKTPSPTQTGGERRTSSLKNSQKTGSVLKVILCSNEIYSPNQPSPRSIPNLDVQMNKYLMESSKSAAELPFDDDNIIPVTPEHHTTSMNKKSSIAATRFSRLNHSTANERANIEIENKTSNSRINYNKDETHRESSKAVTIQSSQQETLHVPVINVEISTSKSIEKEIRTGRRARKGLNKLSRGEDAKKTMNEENTQQENDQLKVAPITEQNGSKEIECKDTINADQDISISEEPDMVDVINPKAKIAKKRAPTCRKKNEKLNQKTDTTKRINREMSEKNIEDASPVRQTLKAKNKKVNDNDVPPSKRRILPKRKGKGLNKKFSDVDSQSNSHSKTSLFSNKLTERDEESIIDKTTAIDEFFRQNCTSNQEKVIYDANTIRQMNESLDSENESVLPNNVTNLAEDQTHSPKQLKVVLNRLTITENSMERGECETKNYSEINLSKVRETSTDDQTRTSSTSKKRKLYSDKFEEFAQSESDTLDQQVKKKKSVPSADVYLNIENKKRKTRAKQIRVENVPKVLVPKVSTPSKNANFSYRRCVDEKKSLNIFDKTRRNSNYSDFEFSCSESDVSKDRSRKANKKTPSEPKKATLKKKKRTTKRNETLPDEKIRSEPAISSPRRVRPLDIENVDNNSLDSPKAPQVTTSMCQLDGDNLGDVEINAQQIHLLNNMDVNDLYEIINNEVIELKKSSDGQLKELNKDNCSHHSISLSHSVDDGKSTKVDSQNSGPGRQCVVAEAESLNMDVSLPSLIVESDRVEERRDESFISDMEKIKACNVTVETTINDAVDVSIDEGDIVIADIDELQQNAKDFQHICPGDLGDASTDETNQGIGATKQTHKKQTSPNTKSIPLNDRQQVIYNSLLNSDNESKEQHFNNSQPPKSFYERKLIVSSARGDDIRNIVHRYISRDSGSETVSQSIIMLSQNSSSSESSYNNLNDMFEMCSSPEQVNIPARRHVSANVLNFNLMEKISEESLHKNSPSSTMSSMDCTKYVASHISPLRLSPSKKSPAAAKTVKAKESSFRTHLTNMNIPKKSLITSVDSNTTRRKMVNELQRNSSPIIAAVNSSGDSRLNKTKLVRENTRSSTIYIPKSKKEKICKDYLCSMRRSMGVLSTQVDTIQQVISRLKRELDVIMKDLPSDCCVTHRRRNNNP